MPRRETTPGRFVRFLRRVVRGITRRLIPVQNRDVESSPFGDLPFPIEVEPGVALPPMRLVFLIIDDEDHLNLVENFDDTYFQELLNHLHNAFEPQGVPPASEKIIESLKDVVVEAPDSNSKCTICLEAWRQGETITKLSCQHSFCKECITQWLKMHNSCPLCRESVKEATTTTPVDNQETCTL